MLQSLNTLIGSSIHARDGEIGTASDYLFDDETWTVRYIVVETGTWLASRRVLISPAAVSQPEWDRRIIPVLLTKDQVQDSPAVDTNLPVSRRQEIAMNQYYGWPGYGSLGLMAPPPVAEGLAEPEGNPHLRSAREVAGYEVAATDGILGRLDDFIIQDADWFVRYLAVGTGTWFAGHNLLVPTRWVESVSWSERRILLTQPREKL
ncbi:MAG: PRC-barrel domain-containing protein [Candidatus Solibacter sp.]